jgi:feruloyl esterase
VTVHVRDGMKITEVFYILKPGAHSFIRCRVAMPEESRWSGRMWGYGRGGWAGNDSSMVKNAMDGDVAASCDMGTGATTGWTRKHPPTPWEDDIWKDFGWRSTHLMTVYAKKFCKAFYGRVPDRSYFKGSSTGGGQGMHEAQRFPEDYDGIVSELPANSRVSLEACAFHRTKLAKRLKLSEEQKRILADAPVEFMADKDASFARRKFLSDPRMCDRYAEAILDVAAKKDPALAEPGVKAALMELFSGPVHKNRRAHHGYSWGALYNPGSGLFLFKNHYEKKHGRKFDGDIATWDDFDDFVAARKECINATDPDLSAFAARGGKIIMTSGLEDQTIPFAPAIDHYEEAAKTAGGMKRLKTFFRMFLVPGCAHGNIGRAFPSCPAAGIKQALVDWVEKGIAPEHLRCTGEKGGVLDVPAYPSMAGDAFPEGKAPGGAVRRIHPFYR